MSLPRCILQRCNACRRTDKTVTPLLLSGWSEWEAWTYEEVLYEVRPQVPLSHLECTLGSMDAKYVLHHWATTITAFGTGNRAQSSVCWIVVLASAEFLCKHCILKCIERERLINCNSFENWNRTREFPFSSRAYSSFQINIQLLKGILYK